MLNRVLLQGRLGSDPELRTTPTGVEVATVNIAVDRDRKDANGERQTDWVTIVAWRSTAKFLTTYFQKGRMVLVEGRLQVRNYTDRDGNKRTAAEVVADNIYFGDSRRDSEAGGYHNYSAPAPSYNTAPNYGTPAPNYGAPSPAGDHFAELSEDDGELPF